MFWNNHTSSATMDVLSRTFLTLGELLDQENILDELKAQNPKLIEFITRQDIMEDLIRLIVEEPSQEIEERDRYRMSNLACEVLTTDLPALNEKLAENTLLSQLFTFLEGDAPLNPLLASFFSRTMSVLISRKSDQHWYSYQYTCLHVIEFFKSKENSLGLLLKHIGTSAIMDLTLKLITQVEGSDIRSIIVNWFESEGLINNVISIFEPSVDSDRHYNAAQLLCDTLDKSRERIISNQRALKASMADDSILCAIQSPETVQKLLSFMLDGELSESSIICGISVLLALIDYQSQIFYNSIEPSSSDENCGDSPPPINPVYRSIIAAILPYLPKFYNLLLNPPHKNGVKLAYGLADPPLGNTRLNIIKLIANLIETRCPLPEVHSALIELDTFNILLDLFFKYTWNNFLHSQIYKCLKSAFEASLIQVDEVDVLLPHIFVNCRLLQRILNAWDENEGEEKNGGKRRGYMGHVILISTLIEGLFEKKESVKDLVEEEVLSSWKDFITDCVCPVIKTQARCLGGFHPGFSHDDDSDGNDFTDIKFTEDGGSDQHSEDQPAATYILEKAFLKTSSVQSWEEFVNNKEDWEEVRSDLLTSLRMSFWNNTEDTGSGSSDEEEKTGADSKDVDEGGGGSFRTNIWRKGESQPGDLENPWGSEPMRAEEIENEKWADFESFFNKFESSLSFEEPTTSGRGLESKTYSEVTQGSVCEEKATPLEEATVSEPEKATPLEETTASEPEKAAPLEETTASELEKAAPLEEAIVIEPAKATRLEEATASEPEKAALLEEAIAIKPEKAVPLEETTASKPEKAVPLEETTASEPEKAPAPLEETSAGGAAVATEVKETLAAPAETKENEAVIEVSPDTPASLEPECTESTATVVQLENTSDVTTSEPEKKAVEEPPIPSAEVKTPERTIYEDREERRHESPADDYSETSTEVNSEPGESANTESEETPQNSSESQNDDGGGSA